MVSPCCVFGFFFFFFSSRRRHTRCSRDWSSDVCSSDLGIRVVAPSGRRVERGPARATGRSVSVDVDAAEQGTYVVNWRVVSGDAQPERGRFTFTVGRPTATVAALPDDMRTASRSGFVLAVVGRALHFLGYALGFGSLAFRWLVLRPLAVPRVAAFDRVLWRAPRFGG